VNAPGPTLETARLILRPTAAQDFEPLCAMMADEQTARFIGGVAPPAIVWRQLCAVAGSWTLYGFAMFSVIEKDTGAWVGRVGPWRPQEWPGTEIGWNLVRAAWGKGYATEAAVAATDWAVDVLGWTDIIHTIAPENLASAAVAKRLGSTNCGPGVLPPPHEAARVDIWGQTAEAWKQRRRSGS
jgi:RimJ/RimL family protein N-acetyltransferase